jgi:RNA polymerase sigma-70 factor (ECF subfamily)
VDQTAVELAVASAHRDEWARVLGATMRITRDLDVAEECVQEAYAAALVTWVREGVPDNPGAWLTTAARRRAVDVLRRETTFRSKLPLLIESDGPDANGEVDEMTKNEGMAGGRGFEEVSAAVPDQRLRLIFMCSHPALNPEAQLALTLRLVCGMPTADIAQCLLVSPSTMSARLTRAKRKISLAQIRVEVPGEAELPARLHSVLSVIYLLFTSGHTAPSGDSLLRGELIDESIHLARLLRSLMPDEPEVAVLLALLLANDARRDARLGADGELIRLEEQDRTLWDAAAIGEAQQLVDFALPRAQPGRFVLQAAIALLYAQPLTFDDTEWSRILSLYDDLLLVWPSPVVALNRAVVVWKTSGPEMALREVLELEVRYRLARYHYLFSVKGQLLIELGRGQEATVAFRRAAELTSNEAERSFLNSRIAETPLA